MKVDSRFRTPGAAKAREAGFTLIELMVAVVIGLVGCLVMFQTVVVSDSRNRTTASGGEAQMTGALAMYNLERDIQLGGMGFGTAPAPILGCPLTIADTTGARPALSTALVPVQITHHATAPDDIQVFYGDSAFFAAGQAFQSSTATAKKAQRRYGFQVGDAVIVASNGAATPASATCDLVQITGNSNPDQVTLDHASGTYVDFYSGQTKPAIFNPAGGLAYAYSSGQLFNLGPSPQINTWTVDPVKHLLLRASYQVTATLSLEVAEGVIDMKAQYGLDTNGDNKVDTWIPNSTNPATVPGDWTQVRAIKVAILVRSGQFEKPVVAANGTNAGVTPSAPTWIAGIDATESESTAFIMKNVDGTTDNLTAADYVPNNWRYYRYKVYQQEIPLRNMIWGTQ